MGEGAAWVYGCMGVYVWGGADQRVGPCSKVGGRGGGCMCRRVYVCICVWGGGLINE